MNTVPPAAKPLTWAHKARFAARQAALFAQGIAILRSYRITRPQEGAPPRELIQGMRQRYREVLGADMADAEEGIYPPDTLFSVDPVDYWRNLPAFLADVPSVRLRRAHRSWRDVPVDAAPETYPPYYRRTFHWQTDGYLSRRSARLYELSVEVLFLGAADVMRRRILRPVVEWARAEGLRRPRVLDLATGTGRALDLLHRALPAARLTGVDLSPFYLAEARRRLAHVDDVSWLAENAEDLPLADATYDVVTSIYLFHELPAEARQRVIDEALRVLRPGGLLVLMDSAQHVDDPFLEPVLAGFPEAFHEPYYPQYVREDLAERVRDAGFAEVRSSLHYISKAVVARKPA